MHTHTNTHTYTHTHTHTHTHTIITHTHTHTHTYPICSFIAENESTTTPTKRFIIKKLPIAMNATKNSALVWLLSTIGAWSTCVCVCVCVCVYM